MSHQVQEFIATLTEKAASDLEAALQRLSEDHQVTSPGGTARSAIDQVAECAMLNGATASLLRHGHLPKSFDFAKYEEEKAALAAEPGAALTLLRETSADVVTAIRELEDARFSHEVALPWGMMTLAQIMTYPHWNMSYHEGQINYIAALFGA